MSDKQFHSKSILHKIWGKIPKLTVRHYPKFSFWELNSHFTVWNSQPARLSPPILFLNSKFLVSKSMFIKLQDNLYRQFQFFLTDYIKIYKKKRTKVLFLNTEKEGFEPSRQITPPNTLAGCRLQPLGHFSTAIFQILT